MTAPAVSVIVVSRERPGLLPRCLTAISQLCYENFEIVVVADPAAADAVRAMGWEKRLKLVAFDAANISAARNAGLAQAAGEIVAFIDDDAVPEPTWLGHLAGPFRDDGVIATGGYVLARNGVSFQWTARAVDRLGRKMPLVAPGADPFEPAPPSGFVAKTEGTNSAFRRGPLAAMGGFDPAFRFYLDETDVNLRLAEAGGRTVIVPQAVVHHGYAASARRGGDRAPRDLSDVGASSAVFWRKHAPKQADLGAAAAEVVAEQKARLVQHMIDGGLEPRDVANRLAGLRAGFEEGRTRPIAPLAPIDPAPAPFLRFRRGTATGGSRYLAGRVWNRTALRRAAQAATAKGEVITIFRFSPTALPHRVWYHPGGWWEQRGGLFGRTDRDEAYFRFHGFRSRVRKEWARVEKLRKCP